LDELDVRELRCFVAVAEELHLGRAAERLGMAEPLLARELAGIERRLGVGLLDRTTVATTLTAAGATLLGEARWTLEAVAESDAGLLPAVLAAYERQQGAVPAELLETLVTEPRLVALAAGHRLAGRRRLRPADLAGEPRPRWTGAAGDVADYWCGPVRRPVANDAPSASDLAQLLRLVAWPERAPSPATAAFVRAAVAAVAGARFASVS
jgi:DNA-binding transcriptional LysR family regulator